MYACTCVGVFVCVAAVRVCGGSYCVHESVSCHAVLLMPCVAQAELLWIRVRARQRGDGAPS